MTALARTVFVERDDGHIGPADGNTTVAIRIDANPLADDGADAVRAALSPDGVAVGWSGTLGAALFDDEPRTWLRAGHDAFTDFCARIAPPLTSVGTRLLLQPHARHVVSDVASTLTMLRTLDGGPFGLALSPTSLLAPSMLAAPMLDRLADHLTRIFEGLAPHADLLILDDLVAATATDEESPIPAAAPLGAGLLPRRVVLDLIDRHLPPETPIVLSPASAASRASSLEWLVR